MGEAVAAADRLRHRVAEPEPGPRERLSGEGGAAEQLRAALPVVRRLDDGGKRTGYERGALERDPVRLGIPPPDVERLSAVGEGVERRADGLLPREVERQIDVVVDSCRTRAAAAADHVAA